VKILVGQKDIKREYRLLDQAIHRAKPYDAEVFVVTSLWGSESTTGKHIAEVEKNLREASDYLERHGVKNQTHFLIQGKSPGEDIIDFAGKHDIDEIIIGVRNRSKVGKLVFGSTAQFVILRAECPVTAVK
jgi:nucleotide-binding universal stress UspA family protein